MALSRTIRVLSGSVEHSIVRVNWAGLRRAGEGEKSRLVCQELDLTDGLASADLPQRSPAHMRS